MGEDKSIHTRLRPSMSKLIIISHVKEGVELALEANLPEKIVDMIPMHHGTTVVEYFFHKALEEGNGEARKEKQTDTEYRYPGPRPRFQRLISEIRFPQSSARPRGSCPQGLPRKGSHGFTAG